MQRIEQRGIICQRDRAVHVFLYRPRDKCPRSDVLRKGCAEAAAEALPRKRHNGHTHVECVAGCASARIWERVERNIHVIVRGEIVP